MTTVDEPPTDPEGLAEFLKGFIRWNNIRTWGLLLIVTVLALVYFSFVQPVIIAKSIDQSRFIAYAANLIRAIQDNPLDFSSGDNFRHELLIMTPVLEKSKAETSSVKLYKLLTRLYEPAPASPNEFESRLTSIYDEDIKPHVESATDLLSPSFLNGSSEKNPEPDSARAVLLTLYASVCKEQGSQGKFIAPYIQGRQLLRAALGLPVKDVRELAYTHNALGANYADTLRNYSSYADFFKTVALREKVSIALKEEQPLSPLALARYADNEYQLAFNYASSNFSKARYLNNSADLRISLINQCHMYGINLKRQDKADQKFVDDNVDLPVQGQGNGKPHHLLQIIQRLQQDLDRAVLLSREPKIYFTRAQLFSLAGALSEKYKCLILRPPLKLRDAALGDLGMAASLGLSREYFDEARSVDLGLKWLWGSQDSRAKLLSLSGTEE
jgi:hypothetical protein